ncbi:glucosyl-3-phosphoglycerate synthase [Desulfobulbus alkaliphilus]|uniref:glucosyl-3-phosphoglycerate synthase n=1 Tax=Desulfobulbus alkaliphilus TaxID=869814 RepID=UPI0019666C9E|nr:glucosyl-3-phosphoglycerate synthase [Desulfobulbus alkaliphilus]MBM9538256.1 glucosyl-3-phosphoglycerate synthase [Desulfobulbus alkaliphilus]
MDNAAQWLEKKTFHHARFADLKDLMRRKERLGLSISLCIPTLNEAATIAPLVAGLSRELRDHCPLLDEIAVIDSGSEDQTLELAAEAGAEVHRAFDILPDLGRYSGKGENLWKALYLLRGDILVFLDGDVTTVHPGYVAGLVGPLLYRPEVGYVKSFYERTTGPYSGSLASEGGRVTEILIRPFFSLYFPELTAIIQPLSGEYAARREILEQLSFPVGYGVEAAHLIDIHHKFGLTCLAQTDLDQRHHRSRSTSELGRMAFAILQVLHRRLQLRGVLRQGPEVEEVLRQFQQQAGEYRQVEYRVKEYERPPMLEVAAYRLKRGSDWSRRQCRSMAMSTARGASCT